MRHGSETWGPPAIRPAVFDAVDMVGLENPGSFTLIGKIRWDRCHLFLCRFPKIGKACLMHRVGYIRICGAQRHLQSVPVYRKAFPMIAVQLSLIEYRSFMARWTPRRAWLFPRSSWDSQHSLVYPLRVITTGRNGTPCKVRTVESFWDWLETLAASSASSW